MRLTLLVFTILIFSSCTTYYAYPESQLNKLTKLNFAPHNNDIDLFFSGESEPEKDYIRIALFKETRTGYSAPPGRLLKTLESRAKHAGADALIVMGTAETEKTFQSVADDRIYTIPRNHMWGIAIRYVENLEEGLSVLSHLTVETLGEIAVMDGGRIEINSAGEASNGLNNKWTKYVYQHSLEYLVAQRAGWKVAYRKPNSGFGLTHDRVHVRGGQTSARVELNYLQAGPLRTLAISYLDGMYASTNMTIHYDDDGRISGREWIDSSNIRVVTNRIYSDTGHLVGEDYQRQRRGEVLQPFLSVRYEYVAPAELRALVEQEQVIKSQP